MAVDRRVEWDRNQLRGGPFEFWGGGGEGGGGSGRFEKNISCEAFTVKKKIMQCTTPKKTACTTEQWREKIIALTNSSTSTFLLLIFGDR